MLTAILPPIFPLILRDFSQRKMSPNHWVLKFLSAIFLINCFAFAGDEAELQVWSFKNSSTAWNGNGPLKYGVWPVKDKALILKTESGKTVNINKGGLILHSDKANVVQIRLETPHEAKCQLWFTTGISQSNDKQKMIEFEIKTGAGMQDYTLDLKNVSAWKDRITSLRFDFLGLRPQDEIAIGHIKVFYGEKISTPMVYTNFKAGLPLPVRKFRMAALFNDDMVLQRDKPVPVWGRGKAGETVTVSFADQTKTSVTDSSGKWQVVLDPMQASVEPKVLTVSSPIGGDKITLENVVVGDVWLCGGQSNMGGSALDNPPPQERVKELLETDYLMFRYVSMPSMYRDDPLPNDAAEDSLKWRSIPAKKFTSAVSYYFGQSIHVSQKIPVGQIYIIKAGSQVEQWLSSESLKEIFSDEELRLTCSGTHIASGLHNGMVAPIAPFPIRGAIWYQGESNSDNEARYMGYYKSLPTLIKSWRSTWGADLPVMVAQLPAFDGRYPENSWPHIREVQLLTSQHLPNVGLAVSIDEGDPKNLHPGNKYFIGSRLGLAARALVYGEKIEYSGPVYSGLERKGKAVSLRFEHVGTGLKARGELKGFEVRGADQRWFSAQAEISGKNMVMLSCSEVQAPEAARYAWTNSPTATLFNDIDLPASPFRTDTPQQLVETVNKSGRLSAIK